MLDLFGHSHNAADTAGCDAMEWLEHCSQREAKAKHYRQHPRELLAMIADEKARALEAMLQDMREPIRAPESDLFGDAMAPIQTARDVRLAHARRIESMQRDLVRRGVLLMTDRDAVTWCESERMPDRPDYLNNRDTLPLFA